MAAARPEQEGRDDPTTGEALALLIAGETESGLALYESRLNRKDPHLLPVGLHLLFLERAGRTEAAESLRRIALRRGGNLTVRHVTFGASPAEIAAEYESLFERGLVNARMVYQYLVTLSRLDRMKEVESILDPKRLLRKVRLDLPAPNGAGALAPAVQALLHRLEAGALDRDEVQPFTGVRMLEKFHRLDDPVARALLTVLREQSRLYLRDWAASDHPLARFLTKDFDLHAWALFSRGDSFADRHVHPTGWATGVYYPAGLPDKGAGGELMIGPPEEFDSLAPSWPRATIRPEEGHLVLMPSYCMHWTMPYGRPGVRTCVAFDLFDRDLLRRDGGGT